MERASGLHHVTSRGNAREKLFIHPKRLQLLTRNGNEVAGEGVLHE
jgi:hypothetical protein